MTLSRGRTWDKTFASSYTYSRWCYDYAFPVKEDVRPIGRFYSRRKRLKKIGCHWQYHFEERVKEEPVYQEPALFHSAYERSSFARNSLYIAVHGYLQHGGEETLFWYSRIYEERKNSKRLGYEFIRHTYAEFGVRVTR
jgi:hypothetical protein